MKKNGSCPFYIQIHDELRSRVLDSKYQYGHYLPSERELSEEFNVERATVRRSLKLLTNDGLIQKIAGCGSKVIYQKEPDAGNSSQFKSVSFVLPGNRPVRISEPFMSSLFNGLEIECKKYGYNLFYTNASSYDDLPDIIKSKKIDAVIWVSEIENSILEIANINQIPSIVYGRMNDYFTCIELDHFGGSQLATQHLIEFGHTKIALINGIPYYYSAVERLRGFLAAMTQSDLSVKDAYIQNGEWTFESGYQSMKRLLMLQDMPTAVYAANDMMALGAIKAIVEQGLNVPDDISIIGFDNLERAEQAIPPLCSIGCDVCNIAQIIGRNVHALVEGHQEPLMKIILPVKLYPRKSVASANGGKQKKMESIISIFDEKQGDMQ